MIHENSLKNLEKRKSFTARPANAGRKKGYKSHKTLIKEAFAMSSKIIPLLFADPKYKAAHSAIIDSVHAKHIGEYYILNCIKHAIQGDAKFADIIYKHSGEATNQNLNVHVDKPVKTMSDEELDAVENKLLNSNSNDE